MRRSFGSDSGRTNSPYRNATPLRQAATQNGARGESSPNTPPRTGPSTKPPLNAAPINPYARARCSGGVMSAMYAYTVVKLADVMPATMRPTASHQRLGASAMST